MELKRYVLLDKKEIIDTSKEIFYFKGENQLYRDRPNAPQVTVRIGTAIKTSDDILDLVEFGDLVELDNEWEVLKVLRFSKKNNIVCMVHTSSSTEEYEFYDYRNKRITTLYKRQPNGDYKKYEVKK